MLPPAVVPDASSVVLPKRPVCVPVTSILPPDPFALVAVRLASCSSTVPWPIATMRIEPSALFCTPVARMVPLVLMASAPKLLLTAASCTCAACNAPALVSSPASPARGVTLKVPFDSVTSLAATRLMDEPDVNAEPAATVNLGAIRVMGPLALSMRPSTVIWPPWAPLKLSAPPAMKALSATFWVLATKPPFTLTKPLAPTTMPLGLIKNTLPLASRLPSI